MSNFDLEKRSWWDFLEEDLQELLRESVKLIEISGSWQEKFHDYSFIVFPAAKAYEGYLKKLFLYRNFITNEDYTGKRFRIGRALNPSLDTKFRDESVYDKITDFCGGKDTADMLWETWKNCRNMLFHWFPDERNVITYTESIERVWDVIATMDESFNVCKIESKSK